MSWADIIHTVFLGLVEGLTEFIPVSSTGHLILLGDLLQFQGPPGKVFEIAIQLGAILAVCWLYRDKIVNSVRTLHTKTRSRRFAGVIILAFLPSVVLGVLLHGFIKTVLFSPYVVSISLIVGGLLILVVERLQLQPRHAYVETLPWRTALGVGLMQTLAMIPGTSRSGATIMGGLLLGLNRKTATEFSFFLAIPTMLAATVYDLYKNHAQLSADNMQVIALGFAAAFVAALLVVKHVVAFISTHGFTPFAYYRIVIGLGMLGVLAA